MPVNVDNEENLFLSLFRYCVKAKNFLKERNIAFEVIELDYLVNRDWFVSQLTAFTNQRTVPNIFINGN